jgi:hypothetical protein
VIAEVRPRRGVVRVWTSNDALSLVNVRSVFQHGDTETITTRAALIDREDKGQDTLPQAALRAHELSS